jgi:hypothetical protein
MMQGRCHDVEELAGKSRMPEPAADRTGKWLLSRGPRSYILEPAAHGRRDVGGDYRTLTGNVHNYFFTAGKGKTCVSDRLKSAINWRMVRQQAAGHRLGLVLYCPMPEA